MSKRLQVLMEESEMREIRRAARVQRLTVAEWVRQALREARRREPCGDIGKKIDVVRSAARQSYPIADMDQVLREIEQGYVAENGN